MKFHLDSSTGNLFTGHGRGFVRVGSEEYRHHVLVLPDRIVDPWTTHGFEALTADDFAAIAALSPELALLGTGASIRFPKPSLTRPLIDAQIGLEVMDTGAACRTFNILASEGRRVVAAIIVDASVG